MIADSSASESGGFSHPRGQESTPDRRGNHSNDALLPEAGGAQWTAEHSVLLAARNHL